MIVPTESRAPKTRLLRHTSLSQSSAKFGTRSFNQSWNGKRCRRLAQLGNFFELVGEGKCYQMKCTSLFTYLWCISALDQFQRSRHLITFNTPNSSTWKYHALSHKLPANSSEARSETPSWCTILFATSGLVTDRIVQYSLLSVFHFLC